MVEDAEEVEHQRACPGWASEGELSQVSAKLSSSFSSSPLCSSSTTAVEAGGPLSPDLGGAQARRHHRRWSFAWTPQPHPIAISPTLITPSPSPNPTSPTGSSSSAPAVAAEATDGPTLNIVSKQLRALWKKHNQILQMEESLTGGRKLNKEQEEVLRSKPIVIALIDELERMRALLADALAEELSSCPAPSLSVTPSSSTSSGADLSVKDLLTLIYFGPLFDVKSQIEFVTTMLAR